MFYCTFILTFHIFCSELFVKCYMHWNLESHFRCIHRAWFENEKNSWKIPNLKPNRIPDLKHFFHFFIFYSFTSGVERSAFVVLFLFFCNLYSIHILAHIMPFADFIFSRFWFCCFVLMLYSLFEPCFFIGNTKSNAHGIIKSFFSDSGIDVLSIYQSISLFGMMSFHVSITWPNMNYL